MIESVLENLSGLRVVICSDEEYNKDHGDHLPTGSDISILKDINSIYEPFSVAITDLGGIKT